MTYSPLRATLEASYYSDEFIEPEQLPNDNSVALIVTVTVISVLLAVTAIAIITVRCHTEGDRSDYGLWASPIEPFTRRDRWTNRLTYGLRSSI